jgi:hypothetical protein
MAFSPAAARKKTFYCFGFGSFAAKTKAIFSFLLPQARKPVRL